MPDEETELLQKVYALRMDFIRRVDDSFVFLEDLFTVLRSRRRQYRDGTLKPLDSYRIPSHSTDRGSERSVEGNKLADIYRRIVPKQLHESFFIYTVSLFESFLFSVLELVYREYPQRLTERETEKSDKLKLEVNKVLEASDIDELLETVIRDRVYEIGFKKPSEYLMLFSQVTRAALDQDLFAQFLEIKATRDIIIHNNGVANDLYVTKAEKHARAASGKELPMSEEYFESSLAIMKSLVRNINITLRNSETKKPTKHTTKIIKTRRK